MENRYSDAELMAQKVSEGKHRQFIGGMWDTLGPLQFEYLCAAGLRPEHRLLDVGCGSLRGGVHFIPYLNTEHYYGFDLNAELIAAGREKELRPLGVYDKVTDKNFGAGPDFAYPEHWGDMDFAIGVSLFTHLTLNSIRQCLFETARVLKPGGQFHTTIFEVKPEDHPRPFEQAPKIISTPTQDPYHYSREDMNYVAKVTGFTCLDIRDFGHPRNQRMAIFERH